MIALTTLLAGATSVSAQTVYDPLDTGPRGLTDLPSRSAATAVASQASAATAAAQSAAQAGAATGWRGSMGGGVTPFGMQASTSYATGSGQAPLVAPSPAMLPPPPPDPSTADRPVVFGSQIFSGRFGTEPYSGYNADYEIAPGDRINVRLWGAFNYEAVQPVDPQGNVFVPNVGPVKVQGVRNSELHKLFEAQLKRTFRANVGVYATLEAAQPVKVFVTGPVRAPGLYAGLSSNSPLYYLDRAGGIDPERGSFLSVDIMRGGTRRQTLNLYRFLLDGQIPSLQLQDGDVIVAHPRQHTVQVSGETLNPYIFEFEKPEIRASELLALARPRPAATHLSIARRIGAEQRSEYFPLSEADRVTIFDGDMVTLTADKYPGTIAVRVDGANLAERTMVLPYGATLQDVLARVRPAPQANLTGAQLYRRSVAMRQKEQLENSLRSLETYALTSRSATSEEAALRTREAELIMQFVSRARSVQPRGQVVLSQGSDAGRMLMEDGDVLFIPERSNLVLVSGEVLFPNALVYTEGARADDYVRQAGGYTQNADAAKLVVLRPDGSVGDGRVALSAGDEVLVLPKVDSKNVEVARGITQIVYQIAIAAKVLLGL